MRARFTGRMDLEVWGGGGGTCRFESYKNMSGDGNRFRVLDYICMC